MTYFITACVTILAHRVSAVEITAMLPPQSGEKLPDDMTKWLLESLLLFMVSEVCIGFPALTNYQCTYGLGSVPGVVWISSENRENP